MEEKPKFGRKITRQMQEQAVKWARDEIRTVDLQRLFKQKQVASCLYRVSIALREAVRSGLLK